MRRLDGLPGGGACGIVYHPSMSVFAQHIAQAKQLEAASQPGRAEAILRDCVKRAPADVDVCRALGGLLMRWGHAGKGAVYLVRAVNSSPQSPELWYELGACCAAAGQFNDAAAALERGLAVAPRQAAFHELLGQVLCHIERFEQASEVIARGLELEPMNALLAQGYVIALKSCGRAGEAARQAERFAGLHADNGEALWLAAWQAT